MTRNNWQEWWEGQGIVLPKKHPVLIFEGCDASGKTTIQEILREIIRHAFLIHTSAPVKGNPKEYFYNLLDKLTDFAGIINQPLFFDRFHVGELVYGSIFRPETIDDAVKEKMFRLEERLAEREAKMVYITASPDTIVNRLKKRGDWYVQPSDVQRILDKYEQMLTKSRLPIFRLDTTSDYTPVDIKNLVLFSYGLQQL